MRLIATGLLLAMAVAFLAARWLAQAMPHPGWGFAIAFTEAAMVGGLADWFAVTALFRHPLGLPIPHTAIIPENKNRIADTMAGFLRDNFLTPQVVARRLRGFNLAAAAGGFLADPRPGGSERLRTGATGLLADILQSLDQEQLGGLVKGGLRRQIERIDAAPLLGQVLTAAIADRRHVPVLEAVIRRAGALIEDNEPLIRAMIHERANKLVRWTGLDEKVANAVLDGLYRLLAETMVDPQHPLRRKLEETLVDLADKLLHDAAMQARVARLKAELLANPAVVGWLDGMWERLRGAMLRALRDPDRLLAGEIGASVGALGKALGEDARLQLLVNRFARRTLVGTASRYGDEIVRLVSETVKRWDARTVTDRVEGAVGRDLQFIRINGTLVGGLVGVAIHVVDRLL
ncbi:MAG: DUF445 domain-containing protein [Novosphingobium sp.]|nr:DUF445 domain-containing protein [Novosphingobium sp.]